MHSVLNRLVWTALCLGLLNATCLAGVHRLDWDFDLVATDNNDLIAEPPGNLTVSVALNTAGDTVPDPAELQVLYDAASMDLKAAADIIKQQITATNVRLAEIIKNHPETKDAKDLVNLPQEAIAQIEILNSVYTAVVEEARQLAELTIRRKWAQLQAEKAQFKAWRLETRVAIGKSAFGVVWGTLKIVLDCTLATPTGGVTGVFLAYDIAKTLENVASLYKCLRTELVSLGTAEKELRVALLNANKTRSRANLQKVSDKLSLVRMKILAIKSQIDYLATLINDSCLKEDSLKSQGNPAEIEIAIAEFAIQRKNWLADIDKFNAKIAGSLDPMRQADELVKRGALVSDSAFDKVVNDVWPTMVQLLDTAMTVWGWANLDFNLTTVADNVSLSVASVDIALTGSELPAKVKSVRDRFRRNGKGVARK